MQLERVFVQRVSDDYSKFPYAEHSDEPPPKQEPCSPEGSTLPGVSSPQHKKNPSIFICAACVGTLRKRALTPRIQREIDEHEAQDTGSSHEEPVWLARECRICTRVWCLGWDCDGCQIFLMLCKRPQQFSDRRSEKGEVEPWMASLSRLRPSPTPYQNIQKILYPKHATPNTIPWYRTTTQKKERQPQKIKEERIK